MLTKLTQKVEDGAVCRGKDGDGQVGVRQLVLKPSHPQPARKEKQIWL